MPHGVKGRSQSVPSMYGVQYGVHDGPHVALPASLATEMGQIREIMRQQEQLHQLSENISQLQNLPDYPRFTGPIICRRRNQPGHFARECDGVHVPPRVRNQSDSATQSRSASTSEN